MCCCANTSELQHSTSSLKKLSRSESSIPSFRVPRIHHALQHGAPFITRWRPTQAASRFRTMTLEKQRNLPQPAWLGAILDRTSEDQGPHVPCLLDCRFSCYPPAKQGKECRDEVFLDWEPLGSLGAHVATAVGQQPVTKWLHWFAIQPRQQMLRRWVQLSTKVTSQTRKACAAP